MAGTLTSIVFAVFSGILRGMLLSDDRSIVGSKRKCLLLVPTQPLLLLFSCRFVGSFLLKYHLLGFDIWCALAVLALFLEGFAGVFGHMKIKIVEFVRCQRKTEPTNFSAYVARGTIYYFTN